MAKSAPASSMGALPHRRLPSHGAIATKIPAIAGTQRKVPFSIMDHRFSPRSKHTAAPKLLKVGP